MSVSPNPTSAAPTAQARTLQMLQYQRLWSAQLSSRSEPLSPSTVDVVSSSREPASASEPSVDASASESKLCVRARRLSCGPPPRASSSVLQSSKTLSMPPPAPPPPTARLALLLLLLLFLDFFLAGALPPFLRLGVILSLGFPARFMAAHWLERAAASDASGRSSSLESVDALMTTVTGGGG